MVQRISLQPMRTRRATWAFGCAFLLVLLGLVQPANAGFFQYSTLVDVGPGLNPAGSLVAGNGTNLVTITTPGAAVITLAGLGSIGPDNIDANGTGSDIVFGTINVAVTRTSPLENVTIPYHFAVSITDYDTDFGGAPMGNSTFDITGTISGTIGAGRKVNLSTNVTNPIPPMLINGQWYALEFTAYVPPGPDNLPNNTGAFGVHVSARLVPEPSTLGLLGLGVVMLATPAYRRWRKTPRVSS